MMRKPVLIITPNQKFDGYAKINASELPAPTPALNKTLQQQHFLCYIPSKIISYCNAMKHYCLSGSHKSRVIHSKWMVSLNSYEWMGQVKWCGASQTFKVCTWWGQYCVLSPLYYHHHHQQHVFVSTCHGWRSNGAKLFLAFSAWT